MKYFKKNSAVLVTTLFISQVIQRILWETEVLNKTEKSILFMLVFLSVKVILE